MSKPRVAAVVCEGQTDVPILRAMIQEIWPDVDDVRCLQPELDEMERAKGPAGWTQVKAWCDAHAGRLDELLEPDLGDPIDLLIVAIDIDIAAAAGIVDPPNQVGSYETPAAGDPTRDGVCLSASTWLPSRAGQRRQRSQRHGLLERACGVMTAGKR